MSLSPDLIDRVAEQTRSALTPLLDADWSVPAHDMEWSCAETAEHIADSYFHHATRILVQPREDFVPASVVVDQPRAPWQFLQAIDACAALMRSAAATADPATRAWHPWGASDPAGSVAMAAVEGLVHTWDVAATLGSDWRPPPELCRPLLDRLFPDAPAATAAGVDATDALLWCTGRTALPDHPRRAEWRWYSAVPG